MLRKKKKTIWENPDYMKIRTLNQMFEINESQRRLKLIDGGEYQKQYNDIAKKVEEIEITYNTYKAFDEIMGHPLQTIDDMMEIFHD